ncbi:hypothetical protein CANINC_001477 [Pichia inconspicua]|uniref:Uncharacterized protein n=1 Tax=Pichia inconspicua TaxID=52247 RepID=A0A4T0X3L8_9ASCO|nr:hypothetical protein CANINC_001477 [[Candida] inconspicua]
MGFDGNIPSSNGDLGSPDSSDKIDNDSADPPRVVSAPIDEKPEESNLDKVIKPLNEDSSTVILESSDITKRRSDGLVQKQTHKLNPKRKAKVFGRGPGRPPGSLNRSTIARLKAEAEALEEFEKNSNSVLPTYIGEPLNSTDQSFRNQSYFNGIAQTPQYYPTQYIPSYHSDQNIASGYMVSPTYVGNFSVYQAYQAHQTPISTQPYTFQPPPPSRASYGNQEMLANNIASVTMQNSAHTSSSDWSHGSSNFNNGSNILNLHNQEYDRRSLELQKLEQIHLQQSYNPSILQPGMVNYNAYQPLPTGYYHSNSLDSGKTFQQNLPPLQTEPTFAMHNSSQPYLLNSTHMMPSNVQQITPFPMSIPASTPQQLPHTNSQYPAYLQPGSQPYERFPEPIQSKIPQRYDICNQSIQRQNEQSALDNQPLKKDSI